MSFRKAISLHSSLAFILFVTGAFVITIIRLLKLKDVMDIIDILYHTIRRDTISLLLVIRFIVLIKYEEFKGSTATSLFSKMVQRAPDKVVLKSDNKNWTFKQVPLQSSL